MVIKVRSIINKCISISVCILFSFAVYKRCMQDPVTQDSLVIRTDSLLADATTEHLCSFLTAHAKTLQSPPFMEHLSAQFPAIKSYTLEKNALGLWICSAESADPILRINDQWVVTDTGKLVLQENFAPSALERLHVVMMPECNITNLFLTTMKTFPSEIFGAYQVVWLSDQEALLYDRLQPNFAIKCNAQSIPTGTMIAQCNIIKHDLQEKAVFDAVPGKKKPQQWIADIRFKNQIVMSQNVGGIGYG